MLMATSSTPKNFVIEGKEQVEMFAYAVDASAHDTHERVQINIRQLAGTEDLRWLFEKRH